MLWKCCTQYASKFEKLNTVHSVDWKRSVFISIPKKDNTKECSNYCTISLISCVSKVMLKILQPGFNSTWTMNFQMFKLELKKAEEAETKLPTSSLVAQRLKRLPPMQETGIQSLGWEDPLEKEMTTHSSILAQRTPWTEEPGRLQSTGSQRVEHDWAISLHYWIIEKAREFQKNICFCFIDYVDHNKLWKILQEMGILDHPTCLLRNLYAAQEVTVRTGHGTADWFQIRKGVCQDCILSPCLFNLYAKYIMRNTGWMKHKLESRLLGEISITSNMQMTPHLWQKTKN